MAAIIWSATKWALWGLLLGPVLALALVLGAMLLDPRCASPGDSGGCAMGLVTAPIAAALPSAALGFAFGLAAQIWRRRPRDWALTVKRLRDWGREP